MRRLGVVAMVLAMTFAAAGCGGNGDDDVEIGGGEDTATTAAAGATTAVPTTGAGTTVAPTSLTLRITQVQLVNSEESDNGMRVLLPAGVSTASVTLSGLPSPNRVISVCQARQLEGRMSGATCRMPAGGEAVTVTLGDAASGVEIVQVGVSGAGPTGNATTLDEVVIRYTSSSREVNARLPQIASGESAGRPSFGLAPPSTDGSYRATLTYMVIPVFGGTPTNAQLELVQGGNVTNQAQSSGEVRLSGNVAPPGGEAAIRAQNLGSAALVAPKLNLLLP